MATCNEEGFEDVTLWSFLPENGAGLTKARKPFYANSCRIKSVLSENWEHDGGILALTGAEGGVFFLQLSGMGSQRKAWELKRLRSW